MASPIRWTWVWVSSGSWWCTGRPGALQSSTPRTWGHCSPWGHKESDTTEQLNRTEPWCLLKLTSSFLKSEQSYPFFDLTSGKLPMSWSRWKLLPLECALGSRISHWPLAAFLSLASKPVTLFTYLQPSHCYQWYQWYHCYHNSLRSLQREKWYLLQISWDSFQWEIVWKKSVTRRGKKWGITVHMV